MHVLIGSTRTSTATPPPCSTSVASCSPSSGFPPAARPPGPAPLRHALAAAALALEGAAGVGRVLAQQLVANGDQVIDVPAKLAAGVRELSTGHGRNHDTGDAVSIALAALGSQRLPQSTSRTRPWCCGCCRTGAMPWSPPAPRP